MRKSIVFTRMLSLLTTHAEKEHSVFALGRASQYLPSRPIPTRCSKGLQWADQCLVTNLTYFRNRRELFATFTSLLRAAPGAPRVVLTPEEFIVIRSFLTIRNDSVNDDKRLAFDKVVMDIRAAAAAAMA